MKKPSQWTPQEAWNEAQKVMMENAVELDGKPIVWLNIPFPADPPEVVDDLVLHEMLNVYATGTKTHRLLSELLARREAERKA